MSSIRDDRGRSDPTPVLVTGGTGTLGRLVVSRLRASCRDVRVLSRHAAPDAEGADHVRCDLLKDDAIETAVDGAETILHLAGGPKGDGEATLNLARAAARTGAKHLVFISVIGADRLPLSYFRSKLAAEQAVANSGIPWTTMRATQFHDLVVTLGQKMAYLPVLPVPSAIRFQPVDAGEVAARLVELAFDAPAGLVRDFAGPSVYPMAHLVRSYLTASGKHRLIMPLRLPGKTGRAYREGANLSLGATTGRHTWEAFLADRFESQALPAGHPRSTSR
jgi:uncharacterized protein YbjT (DUF2867 family)